MKRNKTQKGITLVALIITIIILLILAVVAIRAVQGDGIIAHAKNARDEYEKAKEKEEKRLQGYIDKLDNIETNVETVEQLEEKYEFKYYSKFSKAIIDSNENTTTNMDATAEKGVAAIYTDGAGKTNVVLLKDTTESEQIDITSDVNINLGGRILSLTNNAYLSLTGDITVNIDGRLNGSSISYQDVNDGSYGMIRANCSTLDIVGRKLRS